MDAEVTRAQRAYKAVSDYWAAKGHPWFPMSGFDDLSKDSQGAWQAVADAFNATSAPVKLPKLRENEHLATHSGLSIIVMTTCIPSSCVGCEDYFDHSSLATDADAVDMAERSGWKFQEDGQNGPGNYCWLCLNPGMRDEDGDGDD